MKDDVYHTDGKCRQICEVVSGRKPHAKAGRVMELVKSLRGRNQSAGRREYGGRSLEESVGMKSEERKLKSMELLISALTVSRRYSFDYY